MLAFFWYAAVPVAGAFAERRRWRFFRQRFSELRLKPCLEYADLADNCQTEEFRFWGVFESISPDGILWIRSRDLTVRADLTRAKIYIFPNTGGEENSSVFDPAEIPQRTTWDRISGLAGDARVFVGGSLISRDKRRIFASLPETPLLVIFYEGSEKALSVRAVRTSRHQNEFFNFLTPYAFILGAFSQLLIAITYFSRPAYRMVLVSALIAFFAPLLPWAPPGILFTIIYRRLWFQARIYRSYRDLALFPLVYAESPGSMPESRGRACSGETFMIKSCDELPEWCNKNQIPFLIPAGEKQHGEKWHIFGTMSSGTGEPVHEPGDLRDLKDPGDLKDPFAVSGILPGRPVSLARRYTLRAYLLEIISWFLLLCGIALNVFFIGLIFSILSNPD